MRIHVSSIQRACHALEVNLLSHVASARFHGAHSAASGAGGQAIADYLQSHAGDEYAVVEVQRDADRFSLIVDSEWIRLALSASTIDQDLVDGMELPRNTLLAVVAGWDADWSNATSDLTVEHSSDQIPHLRLTSLRPSASGADRTIGPL